MEYTLSLNISKDDLKLIKTTGLNITLAKPVDAKSPNVIWQAFDPWEDNEVKWEEEYGIYASPLKEYKNGATISRLSSLEPPVQDGKTYKFNTDNMFEQLKNSDNPDKGSYKINNEANEEQYPILTFGLTQGANIHGEDTSSNSLNAALVMAHQSVTFTPITTVYVWLQNSYTSGVVITSISSNFTKVEFGGTSTNQSLTYDASVGMFVKDSNQNNGNKVELVYRKGIFRLAR